MAMTVADLVWQHQQEKVEELQNDVSVMLASHKRMSVGLLQQQDKIEKLTKERDELQKRLDAALKAIDSFKDYTGGDLDYTLLKIETILKEQALKGEGK
ncbi:hypothetical protein ACK0BW_10240 [Acinetobacter baumannii]